MCAAEFNQYQASFVTSLLRRATAIHSRKVNAGGQVISHPHQDPPCHHSYHASSRHDTSILIYRLWERDGIGGEEEGRDAVLSYDNAVPPYSHKWREWERVRNGKLSREQSRLSLPCTDVGVIFLLFSVTWTFCFSQTALHADRMVIFIVIIALNLHVHLWKGSDAWCNSSES